MIVTAMVFPKLQTVEILFRPLSKKHHFRTRFDSEHVKASQILAKSPWERFCQDIDNLHSQFKCNYLENEKLCLNFLFNFWNLNQILNVLKKRIIVIANVFPILQTAKNLLRTVSKEGRFRPGFDSQRLKASQILAKSP